MISAIIITKNEEANIARALASLRQVADEIIVVDSESTDHTREIAQQFTTHVLTRPFAGFGEQKNFAREQVTNEWVLHIDADEEVPSVLAEEIRNVTHQPTADFFFLPIVTEFLGRPLRHLGGTNLRLFRRTAGQWDRKHVHEQIERLSDRTTVRLGEKDTRLLQTPLTHHGHYQTLSGYFERQERYSSADAEEMLATGKDRAGRPVRVQLWNPFSRLGFLFGRAIKQFIKKFVVHMGFLDGWQGWLWCILSAQYEYKMCRKYLALQRKNQR